MNVLFLTEEPISFSETMVRGGQIHVRNVVEGLRERGHEVHLVDWNDDPERSYQHSLSPTCRLVVDPARSMRRSIEVGGEVDTDIVVSKTRKTYLPGLVSARRLGVPHVVHVGSSLDRPTLGYGDHLNTLSFAARLRLPHDAYFVVSEYIATQLRNRSIDDERIFDVKNAVDTDRFHPNRVPEPLDGAFQQQLDAIDDDAFQLGFVGGLQPYKGLDDLAAAIERVDAHCHVVVAGDGPERERLTRMFGDAATFLGSVPYRQVPALYHEFDAFILPSHTEGLPRVVLEAQATATPVVTTRVGGVPEVVADGETGLLRDVADPVGLAAAIDRLAADADERERLGVAGRESVETAYAWDALYIRYEQFLEKVVNRTPRESSGAGRDTGARADDDGQSPG
ncbi:MAG: glycosyltransferase family 4 protein [Halorhabdus sp.]